MRTLAATAYQEWGSVLGKSLVDRSPAIRTLIERENFLLQITLPPGVILKLHPPRGDRNRKSSTGKHHVRLAGNAHRP